MENNYFCNWYPEDKYKYLHTKTYADARDPEDLKKFLTLRTYYDYESPYAGYTFSMNDHKKSEQHIANVYNHYIADKYRLYECKYKSRFPSCDNYEEIMKNIEKKYDVIMRCNYNVYKTPFLTVEKK